MNKFIIIKHFFLPTPYLIRSLVERHKQIKRRVSRAGIPSCLPAQIISGSEAIWEFKAKPAKAVAARTPIGFDRV